MSNGHPHAQMMMLALSAATKIVGLREQQRHQQELVAQQHGAVREFLDVAIHQPIQKVYDGFQTVLMRYAEDAQALREERKQYSAKELECTDNFNAVRLRSHIDAITTELREIRIAERGMFDSMKEFIEARGASAMEFANTMAGARTWIKDIEGHTYEHE
jgi:hypothetical protein